VGLITPHLIHLTIMKPVRGGRGPIKGCSATDDDDDYDQIKERELGGACSVHGGDEKCL
jgi:hypothetical protein